ncbi:protein synthesis inhibitor II-like [Lolium rigidum]|uniref:protein synthesis inhibitor II-like n=1 Tax=Lolium rigidum TaxID=89674 RepID=UPI001F5E2461|nr:protein synthesis inhibitor II-like [Lolium rigidum]
MAAPAFRLLLLLAVAGAVAGAEYDLPPAVVVMNFTEFGPVVDDMISVGVETHDLSIGGFTNGRGHWQSFPGHDHLFPASTPLPFGNSYEELIGGLANLPDLPLGREAMQQAARVLSAYDPATTTDHQPLKRALASLKVMLSEAGRLQPISESVARGWETESRVAPEHLPYIEHWDTMSYEIIRANRTGKWGGPFTGMLEKSANIRSMDEALAVVKVLLNPSFEQVLMAHATIINLE